MKEGRKRSRERQKYCGEWTYTMYCLRQFWIFTGRGNFLMALSEFNQAAICLKQMSCSRMST